MGGRISSAATASWRFEGGRHYTKQGYLDHAKGWTADAASARCAAATSPLPWPSRPWLALSKSSPSRDATVHPACRTARGEKALAEICREYLDADARLHVLDVSSAADIKRFVEAGGLEKLQVLINAGVVPETSCTPQRATRFLWRQQWAEAFCSRLCSCPR